MIFTVDRNDLAVAVTNARQGIPGNPQIPVRAGMLIWHYDGALAFTASDGDVTFTSWITSPTPPWGDIVVPGRLFTEIVKTLPDKPVELDTDKTTFYIKCGSAKFQLPLYQEEYPEIPKVAEPIGTIDGKLFVEIMKKIALAASKVDQNPALHAVKAELSDRVLTLAATDHYRLATATCEWSTSKPEGECLIPASAVDRFTAGVDGPVTLGWDDRVVTMQTGNYRVTSRLIGAKFPKWRGLIPEQQPTVGLDAPELLAALKRAQLVLRDDATVTLTFDLGTVRIDAGYDNRFTETIAASYDKEEKFEAQFGLQYLIDGVGSCGDRCLVGLTTPAKPVCLWAGDFRYIVLPRRKI